MPSIYKANREQRNAEGSFVIEDDTLIAEGCHVDHVLYIGRYNDNPVKSHRSWHSTTCAQVQEIRHLADDGTLNATDTIRRTPLGDRSLSGARLTDPEIAEHPARGSLLAQCALWLRVGRRLR